MSATGKILFWTGLVATLISLVLMFVWLGMCTIWPSIALVAIAPLFRQYVNVCANCKTKF